MTHRQRRVYVLEYKDPTSEDGWSVLMCNTSMSALTEHQLDLPLSTQYRILPYEPATIKTKPAEGRRRHTSKVQ